MRRVHTITDRFSMANTYLIDEEEGLVVVDPGSNLNVSLLLDYLQHFLRRSPTDINLVVLTHLHPDHTGGVEALRQACSAPVAASVVVRRLAHMQEREGYDLHSIAHFAGHILPSSLQRFDFFPPQYTQQAKLVDTWLEDVTGLPYHLSWRVIASPGHTPDSLCLYNPFSHELICGDTMTTVEGGAPLLRSGTNRLELEDTLRVLRSLEIHYLYPGHGRAILAKNPLSHVEVEW